MTKSNSTDTFASLQDVGGIIERHALHWPKKGKLVVQVNPESERSKTWLPHTLVSTPTTSACGCDPWHRVPCHVHPTSALIPFRNRIHWTSHHACALERTPSVLFSYRIYRSLLLCSSLRRRLPKTSGEVGIGHPSLNVRVRELFRLQTILRTACQSLHTFLLLFGHDVFVVQPLFWCSIQGSMFHYVYIVHFRSYIPTYEHITY